MSVSVKSSSKTAIYSHKLFDSTLSIFNSESIDVGSNYSNFNRFEWVNDNTSMKTLTQSASCFVSSTVPSAVKTFGV